MSIRRVLITGAAGNLGAKLRRDLESKPDYALVLLDAKPAGDPAIIGADLSRYEAWTECLRGIDTVVHLAAEPSPSADWRVLVRNNVDATINLFEAARVHGVRRVVFASSLHAMIGYEGQAGRRITTELETYPTTFYGTTKVFGERLGKSCSEHHGLSVICLRLGWAMRDNRPELLLDHQHAQRWLSDRDFCGYVRHAICAHDDVRFAIVHATSAVAGSPWDLSDAAQRLGYEPRDTLVVPPASFVTAITRRFGAVAKGTGQALRRWSDKRFR